MLRLPSRMMRIVLSCLLLAGGAGYVSAQATTRPNYPDTPEGLQAYLKEMLILASKHNETDARKLLFMAQMFVLPNSGEWFNNAYDKDLATKLNAKYQEEMKDFGPNLASLFLRLADPLNLAVIVEKVELSDDPKARAYQRFALDTMVKPVPLYSATIQKEGTSAKIQMWSMVYDRGVFRMVGHMEGVFEPAGKKGPTTAK